MKKMTIFAAALGIAVLTLGGCTAPEKPDQAQRTPEEASSFTITVNETFSVTLESNPSTGYSWMAEFNEEVLVQESDDFVEAGDAQIVGAGGEQVFLFRGISAGTIELRLKYLRPWESVQPIEERVYTVTVTE